MPGNISCTYVLRQFHDFNYYKKAFQLYFYVETKIQKFYNKSKISFWLMRSIFTQYTMPFSS